MRAPQLQAPLPGKLFRYYTKIVVLKPPVVKYYIFNISISEKNCCLQCYCPKLKLS